MIGRGTMATEGTETITAGRTGATVIPATMGMVTQGITAMGTVIPVIMETATVETTAMEREPEEEIPPTPEEARTRAESSSRLRAKSASWSRK